MWKSRRKNEAVRLFGRRVLLAALFLVFIAAISGVWRIASKERESADLRAQAEGQLAELQGRQEQLDADIKKLQTDRGMEEALRKQYALAAAGEHLIVIVDPATSAPVAAPPTFMEKVKKAFSWW